MSLTAMHVALLEEKHALALAHVRGHACAAQCARLLPTSQPAIAVTRLTGNIQTTRDAVLATAQPGLNALVEDMHAMPLGKSPQ